MILFGDCMYDITAIKNYIEYLIYFHNLSVTIHPIKRGTLISTSELMHFNIHNNPYCIYVKSCGEARKHCLLKQKDVLKKCENGSYTGVCYAGIKEYVYPFSDGNENIGFVSVGGYKVKSNECYIKKISKQYDLDIEELKKSYSLLRENMPQKNEIDILVEPICRMLELAIIKTKNECKLPHTLPQKVAAYIRENHNSNITSDNICKEFSCSRAYMSTEFNKEMGKSIREYINELRIKDAKTLLLYSELTITEIAFSVGFNDSNYFTEVFKKFIGTSPIKYRKALKIKHQKGSIIMPKN